MNIKIGGLQSFGFSNQGNQLSISQSVQVPNYYQNSTSAPSFSKPTKTIDTDIFYINDIHGRIGNMARIYSAKQIYDSVNQNITADKFVFSAGDISAGADLNIVKVSNTYMNGMNIDATSDGNHEYDANPSEIAQAKANAKFKSLGMNLKIPKGNPLENVIESSFVSDKNGHKYAIIGLAPPDLHERIRDNDSRKQIGVDKFEDTLLEVQSLVDNYKKQGINKVILLSHCGLEKDQRLAKETSGIDVIIGGHTHDLIEGIEQGKNLLYSKSNEPVIITQAGKDGEFFGNLKITWDDEKGIIIKAQNNVTPSNLFKRNRVMKGVFDHILGKPESLGEIKFAPGPTKNRLIEPNPNAYFIMDAVRSELGTDLAITNAGNVRGFFEAGPIDSRQVFDVVPLKNNMVRLKLTEKEIVDSIKKGAKSFTSPGNKPGIIMPSGLKYTVSKNGEVKSVIFIDRNNKEIPIDINNPDPNKIYTVAMDDFMASGGDKLFNNKIESKQYDERYDFDKDKNTCDFIKKMNAPIEIRDDGRITVVD